MRAPPPTALSIDDPACWRWLQGALLGLSGGVGAAWLLVDCCSHAVWSAWAPWLVGGLLMAGSHGLSKQPAGRLRWTGAAWQWMPADGSTQELLGVDVMMDLHIGMLLRLRAAPRRSFWLVSREAADAMNWPAFRAAVYSFASRSPGPTEPEPTRF